MNQLAKSLSATGLAIGLFAGCSANEYPQDEPVLAETSEVSTPNPSEPSDFGPAMRIEYVLMPDADPTIAELQKRVGDTAIRSGMMQPFTLHVDDEPFVVSLAVPEDLAAQEQKIFITANSLDAGIVLSAPEADLSNLSAETRSLTWYQAGPVEDGSIRTMYSSSTSVIGQEQNGDAGRYHNVATERCQGMDVISNPPITGIDLFHGVKEAVCNTLGEAAQEAYNGRHFADYAAIVDGQPLAADANASGRTIMLPMLSRAQFELMATDAADYAETTFSQGRSLSPK